MLRVWLAMGVGIAALVISGVVATLAAAQAGGDPAAVVAAYEVARNQRDIDLALSYFADDATISQRSTTFAGKDEIRKYLDSISTRSRFVVVSERRTVGNRVTWTERAGGQGPGQGQAVNGPLSNPQLFQISVEAVVQDGKIRSLSYLPAAAPLRADAALDGRAQLPASAGLAAVLAILLGVVLIASTNLRRRAREASSLHGTLIQDLRGWTAARQ
ncbi:MAG TPA: nuclear transport factor 2 family protein [Chloroflexota bacterium]|nr:nuclear transport factor 2 family protein [Chloroflexota bacterium]